MSEELKGIEKAQNEFAEYFVANYPGPNTVISNPAWHAPKIFRAAEAALKEHFASLVESECALRVGMALREAAACCHTEEGNCKSAPAIYDDILALDPASVAALDAHDIQQRAAAQTIECQRWVDALYGKGKPEEIPAKMLAAHDAEVERKARLDEAKWWEHLVGEQNHVNHPEAPMCPDDCMYCARIDKLSRPAAERGSK